MDEFEYNREQVMQSKTLIETEFEMATSGTLMSLDFLESGQTERRWGVEEGAVTYKQRFIENLGTLRTEVELLKTRADNFVAALQECVNALEQDEENAVAAQQALQESLKAAEAPPRQSAEGAGGGPGAFGDVDDLQNNDSDGE